MEKATKMLKNFIEKSKKMGFKKSLIQEYNGSNERYIKFIMKL